MIVSTEESEIIKIVDIRGVISLKVGRNEGRGRSDELYH